MVKALNTDPHVNPCQWAQDNLIQNFLSEKETNEALITLGEALSPTGSAPFEADRDTDIQAVMYRNSMSVLDRPKEFQYYECKVHIPSLKPDKGCSGKLDKADSYSIQIGILVDKEEIPVAYLPVADDMDRNEIFSQFKDILAGNFGLVGEEAKISWVGARGGTSKAARITEEISLFFENLPDYLRRQSLNINLYQSIELHCLISFIAVTLAKLLQKILNIKGLRLNQMLEALDEIEYYFNPKAVYIPLFKMDKVVSRLREVYPKMPFDLHLVNPPDMNRISLCRNIKV